MRWRLITDPTPPYKMKYVISNTLPYIARIWEFEIIMEITIFPISSTFQAFSIFMISVISKDSKNAKVSEEIEDAGIVEDAEDSENARIVSNSHILDNTLPCCMMTY